jgi:superfamily I DNA/RNA helicase
MKPYVLKRGPDDPAGPIGARFSINYEAGLNPGQLAAASAVHGPILVIAGAGSGKTRTLVYRVARLIESGIPPESILLLTFTRKASQEMLQRVGLLIGGRSERVTGGTFHSVGNMLLRRYGKAVGLAPGFTILDRGDSEDVINLLRTQQGLHDKGRHFPRKNTIAEMFSKAANKLLPLEDVVLREFPQFTDEIEDLRKLQRAYAAYKRQRLLVDYDDLLVRLRELLETDEGIRRRVSDSYRYILVDEYQDTNRLQAELVRKMACTHDNVMAVGDDSQCLLQGTPILTPRGYRPVESLKIGDTVLSGAGNGRLVEARIMGKTKSSHPRYLRITTVSGYRVNVSPNHLCFAKIHSGTGHWYVYLMYRDDLGFRIGITCLPKYDEARESRPQMRTTMEQGERLWLLEAHGSRQEAQYREAQLGLRYQIPQAVFEPESRGLPHFKMSNPQAKALFAEFGHNGERLLKDYFLRFEYPTYLPKASKSGSQIAINLLMASASNKLEKRRSQGHELCIESKHGWETVKSLQGAAWCDGYWRLRRYSSDYKMLLALARDIEGGLRQSGYRATIAYKAKFAAASEIKGSFMTIPAAGMLPGMTVPVVDGENVRVDTVKSVEWVDNTDERLFYDLEIERAHNIVSAGVITHNSIYAFRGATFRNIMDFPKLFPGTQLFKLEENYRSTQPILTLANEVINLAAEKYPKTLFTRKLHGPVPVLAKAVDENAQSRFVAQRILELREEEVPLGEIAVLFRSSFHSFDLEIELARRNIPFVKRGGFKFIGTAHVKDVLAHLRVIENPRDAVSWNRLLTLIEGVGPKKSQDLIGAVFRQERAGLDVLKAAAEKGAGASAQGLKALVGVLERVAGGDAMTPGGQVGAVCEYYLPILTRQYDDHPKRLKDLEHLVTIAERYGSLRSFLADLALEPPDESVADVEAAERDDERLVLSTIHSAKGLEWHSVFIIWALDGKFPSLYSFTADEDLEEERRLFYVAITRAKQHLYLTYPVDVYDRGSGMVLSKPTRFLDEVRRDCLDSWSLLDEDDFRD